MRIGIDARFFGPREKGLGIYVQKLIEGLEKKSNGTSHQFFVFLSKKRFNDVEFKNKNFHKVLADFPWYGWREQLFYPFFLNKYKLDLMHFCHFNVPLLYPRKFIVTIHDLILFHFPTFKNSTLSRIYYLIKLFSYRIAINLAVRRAIYVIAISEFTKKDLIKTLKIPEKKVMVIYQGCNLLDFKNNIFPKTILKKYGIISPYLLYVGNAYPHKNLDKLIKAFSFFNQENPDTYLVLAGGDDYFYQQLKSKIKKESIKKVILTGFIEQADLGVVFKEAELFVYPSLYEGFGFPPLEALNYGKNVACSQKTSMPEILEDSVEYFDPEDLDSMINCLKKVYKKRKNLNESPKRLEIIRKFNWDKTTQKTLNIYNSVSSAKK